MNLKPLAWFIIYFSLV